MEKDHGLAQDFSGAGISGAGISAPDFPTAYFPTAEAATAEAATGRSRLRPASAGRRGRRLRGAIARERGPVVLVSGDQELQDEVARLAAAAGVEITTAGSVPAAVALQPDAVLVGSDYLRNSGNSSGAGFGAAFPSGAGKAEIIVVGLAADTQVWEAAAGSAAARVAILPAAAAWLAGYLGRGRAGPGGLVVGVLGGCGGAGASTTSCWISSAAAEAGESVLLIDGDHWGAGLEWGLGTAEAEGIRWPDLAGLSGTLNPVQLAAGLPAVAGFSLLARGNGEPSRDGGVVLAVMDAARRGYGVTVLDLGRSTGLEFLLPFCDQVLLVVPGRAGGILAARSLQPDLAGTPVQVVVRGPLADGWDEQRVAEATGYPLAGYLPFQRGMEQAAENGRILAGPARRRIAVASRRILAETLMAGRAA
ncbi:septum site-determining protein Ssd [Arthrobacter sp. zg-Y1143]|uniref:septum site-determining protein Ssd n=1 Tax=Arthrobacter sp. zg-Y1143 TaxID=3049065 RepID=UPI0024C2B906|nr:septum site-determining protein Ssd [Arthrobacter sp. zg-Y1143]MDK1326754.1 hypothetical protein [Arthrobacter sp. zg-Y1143]